MAGLHCRGYIGAIVDIMADGHEVAGFRACPPQPRTREKIIKAVKAWLETHKSELGVNAYVVSARALAEAFPCSEDGPTAPKPKARASRFPRPARSRGSQQLIYACSYGCSP